MRKSLLLVLMTVLVVLGFPGSAAHAASKVNPSITCDSISVSGFHAEWGQSVTYTLNGKSFTVYRPKDWWDGDGPNAAWTFSAVHPNTESVVTVNWTDHEANGQWHTPVKLIRPNDCSAPTTTGAGTTTTIAATTTAVPVTTTSAATTTSAEATTTTIAGTTTSVQHSTTTTVGQPATTVASATTVAKVTTTTAVVPTVAPTTVVAPTTLVKETTTTEVADTTTTVADTTTTESSPSTTDQPTGRLAETGPEYLPWVLALGAILVLTPLLLRRLFRFTK